MWLKKKHVRDTGFTERPGCEPEVPCVSPRKAMLTSGKNTSHCSSQGNQRMSGGKWAGRLQGSRQKSAKDVWASEGGDVEPDSINTDSFWFFLVAYIREEWSVEIELYLRELWTSELLKKFRLAPARCATANLKVGSLQPLSTAIIATNYKLRREERLWLCNSSGLDWLLKKKKC